MRLPYVGKGAAQLGVWLLTTLLGAVVFSGCGNPVGQPEDNDNSNSNANTNSNDNQSNNGNSNSNANGNSNDNQPDNDNSNPDDPPGGDDPLPVVWSHTFAAGGVGALSSVWGSGPDDVFVVGGKLSPSKGEVYHWDGSVWRTMRVPDVGLLVWVFGYAPDDVTAVGVGGGIIHYDGQVWTRIESGTSEALWGVWGRSPTDQWIVGGDVGEGDPVLLRFDGQAATPVAVPPNDRGATALFKVWGIGSKIFAVGEDGLIIQYTNGSWVQIPTGPNGDDDFVSLWGTAEDRIVAVGGRSSARIAVYDGSQWTTYKPPGVPGLNAVFMDPLEGAIVGGIGGYVGQFDFDTTVLTKETAPSTLDVHAAWGDGAGRVYGVGGRFTAPNIGLALVRTHGDPGIDLVPPLPVQNECVLDTDCDDENPCTDDVCAPGGSCSRTANTASCDDGLYCNGLDVCSGGVCTHSGDPCEDGLPCRDECNEEDDNCFSPEGTDCGNEAQGDCDEPDSCDGEGSCLPNNRPDGTPCLSDGNDCTSDACEDGECTYASRPAGSPCGNPDDTDCDNPNTCSAGGVCQPDNEPNGIPCATDGVDCTVDTCFSGVCTHTGDADHDGVCDDQDQCPGYDDNDDADGDERPNGCDTCPDDLDPNGRVDATDLATLLGAWGENLGHAADFNGDGVVNASDLATLLGAWGDLDASSDADLDGVADACDICPGHDDTVNQDGDARPDACDLCPTDNPDDPDGDGICTSMDSCHDGNDNIDNDGDGTPDACDLCPLDNSGDVDGDGVCNSSDICPGGNDALDSDADGVPNFCDPCPNDNPNDSDADGVCNSADACPGFNDNIDTDGNGVPDGCCQSETDCFLGENCDGTFCQPANGPDLEVGIGGGVIGCLNLPTWPYTKLQLGGLLRLCEGFQGWVEMRPSIKVTGFAPNALVSVTRSLGFWENPCATPADCPAFYGCVGGLCSPIGETTASHTLIYEGDGVNHLYGDGLFDLIFFSPASVDDREVRLRIEIVDETNPAIHASMDLDLTTFVKKYCGDCICTCPPGQICTSESCDLP